jgi:hypothetical protein
MDDDLTDEELIALVMARPATLPAFQWSMRGLGDEAFCMAFLETARPLAEVVSRLVDLSSLDGITIAADYREALLELDRGVDAEGLEPTAESFGSGVAMSCGVIRDGQQKTHVVIEAGLMLGLVRDEPGPRELATHTLVHELAHVAEHALADRAFGGALLRPLDDRYEGQLLLQTHACWSEYYASRISAAWGPGSLDGYRQLLAGALTQLWDCVAEAREGLNYRSPIAHSQAAADAILSGLAKVMKYAGYLIGHAAGGDQPSFEPGDEVHGLLVDLGLDEWFAALATRLDAIYEARREWDAISVFFPLHRSLEDACLQFGLVLHRSDEYDLAWRIYFD